MYSPKVDHIDQLIRFMEALAKLDAGHQKVFIDALKMILHPPILFDDGKAKIWT